MILSIIALGFFLLLNPTAGIESTSRFSFIGRFGCVNKTTGCQPSEKGPSRFYGPAFALAVSDARDDSILRNVSRQIDFDIINTIEASPLDWNDFALAQADAMDRSLIGMMGFDSSCPQILRTGQSFSKLMISILCDVDFNTMATSNSLVQFASSIRTKSLSVLSYLRKMQWDVVYVAAIGDSSTDFMNAQYKDLVSLLLNNDIKLNSSFVLLDAPPNTARRILKLVMDNYLNTRVFIVIDKSTYGDYAARFMDTLSRFGLLQTGEYFVITLLEEALTDGWMTTLADSDFFSTIFYDGNMRCVPTYQYMEQWRSMGFISYLPPMEHESAGWETFVDRIWDAYKTPPCPPLCSLYTKGYGKGVGYDEIPYWKPIALTYDATTFLLKQLNNATNAGINILNGSAVKDFFRNQRIKSVTGKDIYLDSYGAALHQYQLLLPLHLKDNGKMINTLSIVGDFIPYDDQSYGFVLRNNSAGFQYIGGKPPTGKPKCGFQGELCSPKYDNSLYIGLGVTFVCLVFLIVFVFGRQHYQFEKSLQESKWKISSSDIILKRAMVASSMNDSSIIGGDIMLPIEMQRYSGRISSATSGLLLEDYEANLSMMEDKSSRRKPKRKNPIKQAFKDQNETEFDLIDEWTVAKFESRAVVLKRIHKKQLNITRKLRMELHQIVSMSSEFLNKTYGFIYESPNIFTVSAYCSKKSLKEVLENKQLRLENMFIVSFIRDILKGLEYLHQSNIGFHGNLKSKTCLVDATWRVLLNSFGMVRLRKGEKIANNCDLMWTAPELLRRKNKKSDVSNSFLQHADVYSFGILLHEILSRQGPWGGEVLTYSEILEQIKFPRDKTYYRPNLAIVKDAHPSALNACKACWAEQPELRPKVFKIRKMVKPLSKGMKSNLADNLMALIDRHRNNLQDMIKESLAELEEERMRSERLLLQLLPEPVAFALKNGKAVEAEHYSAVTIYFSDIVGFTFMASESTPMQVVELLNDLYTLFDTVLTDFDVYKVETIGDAYMMASGVPERNGINHVGEVASGALRLLESIRDFKITHRPNDPLKLRMGIHSGSAITGVVGVKMPRYCLFGDSVNKALQMESHGSPRRIQISSETKNLLDELGGYNCEERGYIEIKERGKQITYWLNGADPSVRAERLKAESSQYPSLKRASKGTLFD